MQYPDKYPAGRHQGKSISGKAGSQPDFEIPVSEGIFMTGQYEMVIYWSEEDRFFAEAPELPGCMADGATYREAVGAAETVITEWMETARELGRPIPQPHGKLMYA